MVVDLSEFDETGTVPVVEVASRLKNALDVEKVTKKFYKEFSEQHLTFLGMIEGIDDERQRRWYASVLLNRLMFIYFLQRKYFLDNGNANYLQTKLAESRSKLGKDKFFRTFLKTLFFEGFAKPEEQRSPEARQLLGNIRYLNGGLFLLHAIEAANPGIDVPDRAFENLFALFERYSWNLNDTPGGDDNEINPDVLGYIFEKYINQKAFGAYYTRPEITEYLCEQTIFKLVLEKINLPAVANLPPRHFESIAELLLNLDAPLCKQLLLEILPNLSLLDPACGSGAFLVAAMRTLINLYSAIIGKIEFIHDRTLSEWLKDAHAKHPSLSYFIKKRIITDNLFGVDIMEEAVEIAKLRLFLVLVASAQTVEQLEPLPNIDFNILAGNSLIGLMRVNDEDFERRHAQGDLFRKTYSQLLAEKNRLIDTYRHAATYSEDLRALRDNIEKTKREASVTLNEILFDEFTKQLKIKFEQATWDESKKKEGKPKKRDLRIADIVALHPFHWGYEFDEIINKRGGFDIIITNPPWEIFKPQAKEFFAEHSDLVTKNKMTIKEFEKEQAKLLKDSEIRSAWLEYQSRFPHVNLYFRNAPQYKNQIGVINGKKQITDINLYKLFLEQCFNLLRLEGHCGIVIPSGIYTDLGSKQLRELLLSQTEITGLFGFENRKEIFEGVDSRFKFVVLTFEKGRNTKTFPSAFMRLDVEELEHFPKQGALLLSVDLIHRLSPDSLSVMEFKSDGEVSIAKKMLRFPLLGEKIEERWNVVLKREFHMVDDSSLFRTEPKPGRLPLFTGKMFHQFSPTEEHSGYWIEEKEGRAALLGTTKDTGQLLDYQGYRWVHRRIASNTNARTMISTLTPKNVFTEMNSTTIKVVETGITNHQMLFLCAIANSFVLDWILRLKVTTTLNMFYIYQLPVPRLIDQDPGFAPIVIRAAKLICTTPEFDDLAREVGLKSHKHGVTDPVERAKLRAELDGLIAHLYGLTEEEFAYILTTFPLVPEPVKVAAQNAYRDVERGLIK
ncbi:MAG: DNA methyltransferase [Candidatus Binatia bacterium]